MTSPFGKGAAAPLLSVDEAQQRVLAEIEPLETECARFTDAHGRVLREQIVAPFDVPERDNSGMDGYAVRAEDVVRGPVRLRVVEDLPAGALARQAVGPGTAVRIMTGALLPDGADSVAQVEITDAGSDVVTILQPLARGANVRRRGEDMHAGQLVLPAGVRLGAAEIALLAAVQKTTVAVGRRPTVAILSTGDELVDVHEPRTAGKVVNSNAYALAALVEECGALARPLGIVRDTREATIAAIEQALDCDVVVSSGGVSVGAFDFVKEALDTLGAETKFWRVAMKPGKPVAVSRVRGRLFFGLPGNPVSSMVSFVLFVAPALRKALGQTKNLLPPVVRIRLAAPLKGAADRRVYARVRVVAEEGELVAHPMRAQGSGVLTSMLQANGLSFVNAGTPALAAGELAPTLLIAAPFAQL